MATNPAKMRDDLRAKLKGVYDELREVWEKQAELEAREERLKRERDKYEQTIRVIEDEYGLQREKLEREARERSLVKSQARKRARKAQGPATAAEAVDALLTASPKPLSASEIHTRLAKPGTRVSGADDIAAVRTVLSRYAKRYGWTRTKGERPARWRKRKGGAS